MAHSSATVAAAAFDSTTCVRACIRRMLLCCWFVHARREAARATMMADTVSDDDLAAVEDAFFKAAGLSGAQGLQFLAKRRAAGRLEEEPQVAAEQELNSGAAAQEGSS